MKNNKLIISAAGSGKTTYLVNKALTIPESNKVLITTYTNENVEEIRNRIYEKQGLIPSNITVQGWFSFLLEHGVRPFQGSMNDILYTNDIKGLLLVQGNSSIKRDKDGKAIKYKNRYISYSENKDFEKFYFSKNYKIYSDKISKFVIGCNKKVNGQLLSRLSKIYSHILIDEVQDLAGYDLEILKLLFKSNIETTLVGDPRQVTYLTNHYPKHKQYQEGKIKEFMLNECKSLITKESIDESTLKSSHRNNKTICDYSSRLYPEFEKTVPCQCEGCSQNHIEHRGVFLVNNNDIEHYLKTYKPVQLIWSKSTKVNKQFPIYTYGSSKGRTFDRVIIYPTNPIRQWIKKNNELKSSAKSKFYVALTRARYSVAIVYDFKGTEIIDGIEKYVITD